MIKWIKDVFIEGGVSKEEYEEVKDAIQRRNAGMLFYTTMITTILLVILFVLSFVSPTISANRWLYGVVLIGMMGLLIYQVIFIRHRGRPALPACYGFVLLVYAFAIVLGTVLQPHFPATTFCVLLFAVPLIFTDRPYYFNTILIVVAVAFCYVSFRVKEPAIANLDEVNAMSFLLLGIVVNTYLQRMKIRELVQRKQIEQQRDTDELTKLMTRAAAEAEIQTYMKKTKDPAALLVLDIDDFKGINDTWGHAYGDAVLRIMGECIQNIFKESGICGRYGGDEFLVFLPHTESKENVANRIEKLEAMMKDRLKVPQLSRKIHGSIGVACYPQHATTYQELFAKADEALYTSKANGKDCYTFYFDSELLKN